MKTAGILLAAGKSTRFGQEDKLLADLQGKPLVTHAADALRSIAPEILISVARSTQVLTLLSDMQPVSPDPSHCALSTSLRAGIAKAQAMGADCALVVLGDMPFITPDVLNAVVRTCTGTTPAAASDGAIRLPPACFPASRFSELMALAGDTGAGAMLAGLPSASLVICPPDQLRDIDRKTDLPART